MKLYNSIKDFINEKKETLNWISYRITYPISDYIVDETNYTQYTKNQSVESSRTYISNSITQGFGTIIAFTLFTIFSYIILQQFHEYIFDVFSIIGTASNIPLAIIGFIVYIIDIILFIISESSDILTTGFDSSDLSDELIEQGENFWIIGAILFIIFETISSILDFISVIQSYIIDIISVILDVDELSVETDTTPLENVYNYITEFLPDPIIILQFILIIIAPLTGVLYTAGRLVYPIYVTSEKSRKVESSLPRAYMYLYALTEGGLSIKDAMNQLGKEKETYGEVTEIFKEITYRVDYNNYTLNESLLKTAKDTQSEDLEDFLISLTDVLDTGSDVTKYLENKSQQSLEEARDKQKSYIELLEILSEGYIITFVAAPVFIIILQLVSGMTGGFDRGLTQMIPYAFIPAGGLIFITIVYFTGQTINLSFTKIEEPKQSYEIDLEREIDKVDLSKKQFLPYRSKQKVKKLKYYLKLPIKNLVHKPHYSLFIMFPITIFYMLISLQLQLIPTGMESLDEDTLQLTFFGYYIPLLLFFGPWMIIYESKRIRRKKTSRQLPVLFSNVAESNKRGLTLENSLKSASESGSGELFEELKKSIRLSKITGNLNKSLIQFSNKMRNPHLSQSINLLTKSSNVSGNINVVIEVLSNDFKSLYDINRTRIRNARIYVIVTIISLLISTGVLLSLEVTFFDFITGEIDGEDNGEDELDDSPGGQDEMYGEGLPIDFFKRIFLHTVMSLSVVSGLASGVMENGDPQNGLKYVLGLTTLTLFAFIFMSV